MQRIMPHWRHLTKEIWPVHDHDRCRGGEHLVWRRHLAGDMVT